MELNNGADRSPRPHHNGSKPNGGAEETSRLSGANLPATFRERSDSTDTDLSRIEAVKDYRWRSWTGKNVSTPKMFYKPATVQELQDVVRGTNSTLRVVGGSYSCSPVAVTDDVLVSIAALAKTDSVDLVYKLARVGAGSRVDHFCEELNRWGLALRNQADINQGSLAGIISTGSHGTGPDFQSMANDVRSLKLVNARGELVTAGSAENSALFKAALSSFGALGVIVEYEFQCRDAFRLREQTWSMPLKDTIAHIGRLMNDNRNFQFFAFPYSDRALVRVLNETDAPVGIVSKDPVDENAALWMISEVARRAPFLNRIVQGLAMKFASRTERVDASYRIYQLKELDRRTVQFSEMEYHVPREVGIDCFMKVREAIRENRLSVGFPMQFRWVKADDIWLSPFYGRDSASIAVHQYHKQDDRRLFEIIEPIFQRYQGRPHWGKCNSATGEYLRSVYPKWDEFRKLRAAEDPTGKFLSPYLKKIFEV